MKMNVRLRKWRKCCVPVIVLDVKRGAGRAAADRVIIGELAVAADVTVVVKLSAAAQANKTSFVFMIFDLSNHWTPRRRRELLIKTMAVVTQPLPCLWKHSLAQIVFMFRRTV